VARRAVEADVQHALDRARVLLALRRDEPPLRRDEELRDRAADPRLRPGRLDRLAERGGERDRVQVDAERRAARGRPRRGALWTALGVDLNALALAAALGERPEPSRPEPQVGGAVTQFLVPPEGRLVATEGEDDARAVEGVLDVRLYRSPGHEFGPFRTGPDRAGAVLAVGESREEALARARRATDLIRFVVSDAEVDA